MGLNEGKTPAAIKAMRNAAQTFLAEHEDKVSSLFLTDLAHDERAHLAHPTVGYCWIIHPGGTHMVRTDGTVTDNGPDRKDTRIGRHYLRCVVEVFPRDPMEFFHWDGTELRRYPNVEELISAAMPEGT